MKIAAIDYGLERTGLAISDHGEKLAFPLSTLSLKNFPNRKALLDSLAETLSNAGANAVVMGLPLLDDGSDSETTRQVRNVTKRLMRRLQMPFYTMPETLTSFEAWGDLREAGLAINKRKKVLDQQAAVRILSSFLALPMELRERA